MPELIGATCDAQALLNLDPCKAGLSPYLAEVVKTQIYCELKAFYEFGWTPSCDIQTLLQRGNCFAAMPQFILSVLQAQLLCDTLNLILNPVPPPDIIWNGGEVPPFDCEGTIISVASDYYFELLIGQNPNEELTAAQIACMVTILDTLVADYIAANPGTLISQQYYWAYLGTEITKYSGVEKSASGNCDPNSAVGNVEEVFVGAYYPVAQLCFEEVVPPDIIWNGGDPPPMTCPGTEVLLEAGYYFGLVLEVNPNDVLSEAQLICMEAILDIIVSDYLAANPGVTITERNNYWQWISGSFFGYSGVAKASGGVCDPNDPTGDVNVLFNGAYVPGVQLCVE